MFLEGRELVLLFFSVSRIWFLGFVFSLVERKFYV